MNNDTYIRKSRQKKISNQKLNNQLKLCGYPWSSDKAHLLKKKESEDNRGFKHRTHRTTNSVDAKHQTWQCLFLAEQKLVLLFCYWTDQIFKKKLLILHQKIKSINSCLLWRAQLSKKKPRSVFPKCLSLFSPVLPKLNSTTSTIIHARIYPMMLKLHTIIYTTTMNRTQNTEKSRQVSIRNESQCDIYGATSKLQQNYTSDATYKLLL